MTSGNKEKGKRNLRRTRPSLIGPQLEHIPSGNDKYKIFFKIFEMTFV